MIETVWLGLETGPHLDLKLIFQDDNSNTYVSSSILTFLLPSSCHFN